MIVLLFNLLSLLILLRVIFSLIGYNYGSIYDFVYLWSEKILAPIRKRLPLSRIDWSPLVALVLFDLGKRIFDPLIYYIANDRYDLILPLFYYVTVSLLSSVTTFIIILFIVRLVNDALAGDNYAFSHFINSATEPFAGRIRRHLPVNYKRYYVWVTLVLLIIIQTVFGKMLNSDLFTGGH
ncbi:MAG: YggT family protein [Candidatus Delongbacteria bacterium]